MWIAGYPMPPGIGWPTAVVLAFGIAWALTAAASAIALRGFETRDVDGRLRSAMSARLVGIVHLVFLPALVVLDLLFAGHARPSMPARAGLVAVAFAAMLAVRGVAVLAEYRICRPPTAPPFGRRESVRLAILAATLGWPTYWTYALVAAALPGRWGPGAAAVMGLGMLALVSLMFGSWLGPLRRAGQVRPASERLARIVAGVAERVGVRPRDVVEFEQPHANALAMIPPMRLIYCRPILDVLDDPELAAITAHELGHLSEPRRVVALRVLQPFVPLALFAWFPAMGSGPIAILATLGLFFATLGVLFFHARAARKMELRCDAIARENEGETGTYGRALTKVYAANQVPMVGATSGGIYAELRHRAGDDSPPPEGPTPPRITASFRPLLPLAACAAASYIASEWTAVAPLFGLG